MLFGRCRLGYNLGLECKTVLEYRAEWSSKNVV
jgi:hypothetical protein